MRQKELFPQKKKLEAYCQGKGAQLNLRRFSPEHVIRFWLYGQVADHKINLSLFDSLEDDQADSAIISQDFVGCLCIGYRTMDCHFRRNKNNLFLAGKNFNERYVYSALRALLSNRNGIGAMSNLIWWGVFMNNREEALYWASRKAGVRMKDIEAAKRKTPKRFKRYLKKNLTIH